MLGQLCGVLHMDLVSLNSKFSSVLMSSTMKGTTHNAYFKSGPITMLSPLIFFVEMLGREAMHYYAF
jgi:hypothetical protein